MAKRKTIEVEFLLAMHERMMLGTMENPAFIASPELGKAARNAINIGLETVLHETGNYRGFRYLVGHEIDDTARFYYSV